MMATADIALVTGAAGFIGKCMVKHLTGQGVSVRATDLQPMNPFTGNPLVSYHQSDLTRPETLAPLFRGDIDRVFHLGAICNFSTPYRKLHPVNVQGVRHITGLALQHQVKRFVHFSSTSIFGSYRGKPFTENDDRNPIDDYGRSKRDGEKIVFERIREGLPATILLPCTVYGPGCNDGAGKVFSRPSSIDAIPGSGKALLSNIRVEDVAAAADFLSRMVGAAGNVYNLADNSHPSVEEALIAAAIRFKGKVPTAHIPLMIVKLVARINGMIAKFQRRIPELEYDAVKYLEKDYIVDNSKLRETGFQLAYPDFSDSIKTL